jgi:hypothetical protein
VIIVLLGDNMEAVQSATRGSLGYGFVLALAVAVGVAGYLFPVLLFQSVLVSASGVFVLLVGFAYLREVFYAGRVAGLEIEERVLHIKRLRSDLFPADSIRVPFAPEEFVNWIFDYFDANGSWPSVRQCVSGHRGWNIGTVSEWFGLLVSAGAWVDRVEGGSSGQPSASWNRARFVEVSRLSNSL